MVILQSCCCWRSVRKGSYASAIYTAIYFSLISIIFVYHLKYPQDQSILEPEGISDTSVVFSIIILTFSVCGIISSFILIYGLYTDRKILLIPWILTVMVSTLTDLIYCFYSFVGGTGFNPLTAILFTLDFFVSSLNVYALLCVVSQYQEYKAGRGRSDDHQNRVPSVNYSAPTTTSYLNTKRVITYHETRPTPTQSPTGAHTSLATDEPSPNLRPPRKHVQFPDQDSNTASQNGTDHIEPWTIDVKSPNLTNRRMDTAPLLDTCINPSLPQPQV